MGRNHNPYFYRSLLSNPLTTDITSAVLLGHKATKYINAEAGVDMKRKQVAFWAKAPFLRFVDRDSKGTV